MVTTVTDGLNQTCGLTVMKTEPETQFSVPEILHPVFASYEAYARVAILLLGLIGNVISILVLSRFNNREHWIISYFTLFTVLETLQLVCGLFSWFKIGLWILTSGKTGLDIYAAHGLWCRISHVMRWTLVFVLIWSIASCAVYRAYHTKNDDYRPKRGLTLLLLVLTGVAVNSPFLYAITVYTNCQCLDHLFIFNHQLLVVLIILDMICPMVIIMLSNTVNICLATMKTDGRLKNVLNIVGHGPLTMKRKNEQRYTTSFLTFSSLYTLLAVPMLIMNLIYLKLGTDTSKSTQNIRLLTMRIVELECACLFPLFCLIIPQFWKETRHLFVNGLNRRRLVKSRNSIIIN